MMTTSTIGGGVRHSLRVIALPTAMLSLTLVLSLSLSLTACGDKEAPINPTHRVQLAEARAATERERSLRQLAEDRRGTERWLALLAVGGALVLGLAAGSPSPRKTEGAKTEGDRAEGQGTEGPDMEGAKTEGARTDV